MLQAIREMKFNIKIADLGFSKKLLNPEQQEMNTYCGTPINMAPEIMRKDPYTYKVDIWSTGTMLFEMLTGFAPFNGMNKADLQANINIGFYKIPKNLNLSLTCLEFLHKCLQFDPQKRFTFEEIMEHPFIVCEKTYHKLRGARVSLVYSSSSNQYMRKSSSG